MRGRHEHRGCDGPGVILRVVKLPGPLVSSGWLREQLLQPSLVIADVRWVPGGSSLEAFGSGHIPGAVFLDVDADLARPAFESGPGRHPLPSPEAFAATMRAVGIDDQTPVVTYDDVRGSVAARLWWMLDATGHRAALLDGGLEAWDGPIETGPPARRPSGAFTARPWPRELIANAHDVTEAIRAGHPIVLDARAGERYRGETEPFDPVAGHIPGASSAPWTDNLDPDSGRFLAPDRLRKRFAALGVSDASHVIVHCGSGVTTCHDVLAMRVAGLGPARVYEGSWSDWVSDPDRPVATGV